MRQKLGLLASFALIGATAPLPAFAGGVFFGFGGGPGNVDFENDTFADSIFVPSDDSFVGEWLVGYRFDSKLVIEGGGTAGLSLDFFFLGDFFSLSDERVMVGYAFQPSERFSIVPKLGVSRWHLDTESGTSFFGSERADVHDSGSDLIWRINGEWRVAERLHLYAAYSDAHYSFGDSSGPSFGFKFQF